MDFAASGINDNETWLGPFLACPQNEVVDAFEVNFAFPNGICGSRTTGISGSAMSSMKSSIAFMVPDQGGRVSQGLRA